MPAGLVIQLLGPEHDRSRFTCDAEHFVTYLKQHASQEQRRDLAAVYVLTFQNSNEIIGYYTLSSYAISPENFPDELKKKLPKYTLVPATLIGRLAASNKFKGKNLRLGESLLIDALLRAWTSRGAVGSWAVVVDSEPDTASFYLKYGFVSFPGHERKFFMTMGTIGRLYKHLG